MKKPKKKFTPVKPHRKGDEPRGQLNIDLGLERRTRLSKFCAKHELTLVSCIRQMVDFCLTIRSWGKKDTNE